MNEPSGFADLRFLEGAGLCGLMEERWRRSRDAVLFAEHPPGEPGGGRIVYANPAFASLAGRPVEDLIGKDPLAFLPPDLPPEPRRQIQEALESGKPASFRAPFSRHDGPLLDAWWELTPLRENSARGPDCWTYVVRRPAPGDREGGEAIPLVEGLARAVSQAKDPAGAYRAVLRKICRTCGWSYGEAWVPSEGDGSLEMAAAWSEPKSRFEEMRRSGARLRVAPDKGTPAAAWSQSGLVWVENLGGGNGGGSPRADEARRAGFTTALSLPIRSGNHAVATLCFFFPQHAEADDRMAKLVADAAVPLGPILERKGVEAQLRARIRQQEAVAELTRKALYETDLDRLFREAVRLLVDTLDTDFCEVLEHQPDADEFLLRAGWGWKDGCVGSVRVQGGPLSHGGYALALNEPVVMDDIATESRFAPSALLVDHGVRSGLTVAIRTPHGAFGVLGTHVRARRAFHKEDIHFLHAVANTLGAAVHRARVEEAGREGDARIRAIVGTAPDGIFTVNAAGTVLTFNPAAERLFGYAEKEIVGKQLADLLRDGSDAHAERLARTLLEEAGLAPGAPRREVMGRRKDGGRFPMYLSLRLVGSAQGGHFVAVAHDMTELRSAEMALRKERSFSSAMLEATGALFVILDRHGSIVHFNRASQEATGYTSEEMKGKIAWTQLIPAEEVPGVKKAFKRLREGHFPLHYENHWITKNGRKRWIAWNNTVVLDAAGEVEFIVATGLDITERKTVEEELSRYRRHLEKLVVERTAELEQSHEQLRLAERLASVGTLAAGLGHDMGNMLLPMLCRLDALDMESLPEKAVQNLVAVRHSVNYLRQLSQGLRLFALDPEDPDASSGETDLAEWWPQVRPLARKSLSRNTLLEEDIPDNLPPVAVPQHRLTQAIFNLMVNAGDAVGDGGTVRIWATPLEDRRFVCLGVRDDGVGMSPEVRRQALDPFFTTKTRTLSTGLGLSLVHAMARAAGGVVRIDSEPGKGTSIVLTLPTVQQGGQASERRGVARKAIPAAVAVEDPRIAAYASLILSSAGFEVRHARDPDTKLWVLEAGADSLPDVESFLDADSARRVVLCGASPRAIRDDLRKHVIAVNSKAGVEGLRRALGAAATQIPGEDS